GPRTPAPTKQPSDPQQGLHHVPHKRRLGVRLIAICAAGLVGLAAADVSHPRGAVAPLLLGAVLSAVGACLAWRRLVWRNLALMACVASLGAARGSFVSDMATRTGLEPFVGRGVRVRAVANAPPTFTATSAHLAIQ